MSKISRKDFIKTSSTVALGASILSPHLLFSSPQKKVLKVGIIGTGMRGREHLRLSLNRSDVIVTAICDIEKIAIQKAFEEVEKAGKKKPELFSKGPEDYKRMLKEADIDAVFIATPWTWHAPMAVASMKAGKYTGLEVSGLSSLDECWDLVNTHEETGSYLFFLENVNYRRDVMAIMNMVRKGMFGELIHMEGGYQHDLRGVKFNDGTGPYTKGAEFGEKGYSEAVWRTKHSVSRNGELYPTHGVGPVAAMLNINRGNLFQSLTSTSSNARGLHNYIVDVGGENHPNAKVKFNLGDVVTTVIKCANGETILLSHDTNLPRPYSLGFRVQGTKGIWMDVNKSLYIEGVSEKAHRWEDAAPYLKKYDHPIWRKREKEAQGAGHGGMDYFVTNSFFEHAKRNVAPPIDVYDAAAWSAITPLSEKSIATGSMPQAFPDFTNGKWVKRKPVFGISEEY